MTNFFGINITEDKKNMKMDAEAFKTKTVSAQQSETLAQNVDTADDFEKKGSLSIPLEIIKFVSGLIGVITLGAIFKMDEGIAESFRKSPTLFYVCAVSLAIAIALFILERFKAKKVVETDDFKSFIDNSDVIAKESMETLGIPENAASIDFLCENYVIKDGEVKHKNMPFTNYINLDLFVYEDRGNLCIDDLEQVFEIPMTALRSIELTEKKLKFEPWNKEEPCTDKKYKQFKIREDDMGGCMASCYRVELKTVKGDYYLLIPIYDGEEFMKITRLHPREFL